MIQFRGVLLKPIEQQADRQGDLIDPTGVDFDPDGWYPIIPDFRRDAPPVGRGRVKREEDGSLVVDGELFGVAYWGIDLQPKLAIGVATTEIERGSVIEHSTMMPEIGICESHADLTQPSIVITHRGETMNLVRLGHYHTPTGADDAGFCQTALVVGVGPEADGVGYVSLVVWDKDGDSSKRLDVPVASPLHEKASFHLSGECPWSR